MGSCFASNRDPTKFRSLATRSKRWETLQVGPMLSAILQFGVSTQDFFNFIQGDPSLLAGIPTLGRVAAWGGGFPIKVDGEIVGAIGLSGRPRCRTTSIAREQP